MDLLASKELEDVTITDVLRESVRIPFVAPRTFVLIHLSLVYPLSFAIIAHSLFTHPIIMNIAENPHAPASEWLLLFLIQFIYLLLLFTFSLLSTASVVFTVASLYSNKPVAYLSTLSAIRPMFMRLFRTFLWVSLLMVGYNGLFVITILILLIIFGLESVAFILLLSVILVLFIIAHVYISAIWHLASVISVLEPVSGLEAMKKSQVLLQGRGRMAAVLVITYLGLCGLISSSFRAIIVKSPDEQGSIRVGQFAQFLIGGFLIAMLAFLNFVGLLVQSVFYYVCKSFHHQEIDKSALFEHLGGYLGEYVPLTSSIQMENL